MFVKFIQHAIVPLYSALFLNGKLYLIFIPMGAILITPMHQIYDTAKAAVKVELYGLGAHIWHYYRFLAFKLVKKKRHQMVP